MSDEMNLVTRVTSPLPSFFVKVRAIALSLSGIAVAVIGISKTLPDFVLPDIVTTVLTYIILIGGGIAATAQTTVK